MRRGRPHHRGQGLVEFALVLPIFAVILFGIIDVGRYVATANAISNGTREAARVASVGLRPSPQCDGLSREACAISVAGSNAWFVAPSQITTTVTCERLAATGGVSSVPIDQCRTNDFVTVNSQTDFTLVTPLIAQVLKNLHLSAETKVLVNQ